MVTSDPEAIESLSELATSHLPKPSLEVSQPASKSAFGRRLHDRRFVRHAVGVQHQPTNWLAMDIQEFECKLMEVKKFSAEHYNLDAKFRRPQLELISSYAVQNPFLHAAFMLRKEQLSMQLFKSGFGVKEQLLYAPVSFSELSLVVRNNFFALTSMDGLESNVKFYTSSEKANQVFSDKYGALNPRLMVMTRVLMGVTCDLNSEQEEYDTPGVVAVLKQDKEKRIPYFSLNGHTVDSVVAGDTVYKMHPADVYPAHVLVYRDKSGESDSRASRLESVLGPRCQLSYRAGTRFNPQEQRFIKPTPGMDVGIRSGTTDNEPRGGQGGQRGEEKQDSACKESRAELEASGAIPKQTKRSVGKLS